MRSERLPSLVPANADVVFVGTEPGKKSLEVGAYYADPTNRFWRSLSESGWLRRGDDAKGNTVAAKEHGIGLDDVYDDAAALVARLAEAHPKAICFNSKDALNRFRSLLGYESLNSRTGWRGALASQDMQVSRHLPWTPIVWAVPDSSGQAGAFAAERVSLLQQLRERLQRPSAV